MIRVRGGRAPIPAVVVGAAGACGLGLVRSLRRADIPIILVDDDPSAPAMHTRFARKVPISGSSGPSLVTDLLALGTTFADRPVLFLTGDEATLTVSEHRAELARCYRFRMPSHDDLVSLMHKTGFLQLAEAHGFPVPRSVRIESVADLGRLAEMPFPAIVKPAMKKAEYLKGQFARAYKVASLEQADAVCRRILPVVPDLVVQEWIDGADSELYFCLQYRGAGGATVCSFTGRKLSIWPPDVGVTASCTAAPDAQPVLERLTEAFFRRVSFVGMGGIEFKRDARTGRFLMIEPTVGRVDAQEEVATIHGVNIPLAAYLYEVGLAASPVEQHPVPVIWRDSWLHWRSTRGSRSRRAAQPSTRIYDVYWRLDDPMPALFHVLGGSVRFLQRAVRRYVPYRGRQRVRAANLGRHDGAERRRDPHVTGEMRHKREKP
ncbi:MAG TPA: FAD-dependent oxidoreductase [bacterium]|nr:FAD-dependent oxidoreductase [bacterium]